MKCPKCKSLFNKVLFEGTEIERCSACNGMWFDILELQDLLKKKGSERIDIGDQGNYEKTHNIEDIYCPKDNSKLIKMVDIKQGHIWFESCGVCKGVFLDATEFKDMKDFSLLDIIKTINTPERNA